MSKIGAKPVTVSEGVNIKIENGEVKVDGPKGSLSFPLKKGIEVKIEDGKAQIMQKKKNDKETSALFGLTRAMIANMVKGVSTGFEKRLELAGVGYRAQVSGNDLSVSVGFSHPVKVTPPEGVKFQVEDNVIVVSGVDKTLVGNTAASIRDIRPPEPYKGKGIKYQGERIRRKVGKAAKAVGGAK